MLRSSVLKNIARPLLLNPMEDVVGEREGPKAGLRYRPARMSHRRTCMPWPVGMASAAPSGLCSRGTKTAPGSI